MRSVELVQFSLFLFCLAGISKLQNTGNEAAVQNMKEVSDLGCVMCHVCSLYCIVMY